jgi:hypothetical protein
MQPPARARIRSSRTEYARLRQRLVSGHAFMRAARPTQNIAIPNRAEGPVRNLLFLATAPYFAQNRDSPRNPVIQSGICRARKRTTNEVKGSLPCQQRPIA